MNDQNYDFWVCKELFQHFLTRYSYSSETSQGYEKDLQMFSRFMKNEKGRDNFTMLEVKKEELLHFMDYGRKLGHKTNTVARRLSTLKSFYKFLVYELDFPIDVAARIKVPKAYIPLTNILSERQVKSLLEKADELGGGYQLLFNTLYYTGSRLTPVRTLKKSHVFLDRRIIYFPKVKGGKDLYLPMHECLVKMFDNYFRMSTKEDSVYVFPSSRVANQPISATDVRNKLRIVAERAGLPTTITPHSLRHCTATHLTINRVDQRTIASILGHSDLRSTMRYQHLSVDHLREPINSL